MGTVGRVDTGSKRIESRANQSIARRVEGVVIEAAGNPCSVE
jgi:hypothetical protein